MGAPFYTIHVQGAPLVASAWMRRKSRRIVCIDFDMQSKYCDVYGWSTGAIYIGASEHALKLSPDHDRNEYTTVRFTGKYAGWDVFSASGGRYTLHVCLVQPETRAERWRTELKYVWWGIESWLVRLK